MFRLAWWQALFVKVVIRAQPGDTRTWGCIQARGEDLSESLTNDH